MGESLPEGLPPPPLHLAEGQCGIRPLVVRYRRQLRPDGWAAAGKGHLRDVLLPALAALLAEEVKRVPFPG